MKPMDLIHQMTNFFNKNERHHITYYNRGNTRLQKTLIKLMRLSHNSSRYEH